MELVIIGGGPGGYSAALRAARLGAKVTLIEKNKIGGTCLNIGCMPTKVLLHTTDNYALLKEEAQALALKLGEVELDWGQVQVRKDLVVEQLVEGVKQLLEAAGVKIVYGKASFISPKSIQVEKVSGGLEEITFKKAIIATGSKPIIIPIAGNDLEAVITSEEALSLEEVPESITIVGGGVIGVEFANIFANLGCQVTVVEMLPSLLANMDEDIVEHLEASLEARGVKIYKDARVEAIKQDGDFVNVFIEALDDPVASQKVLMATGRLSNTQELGLDKLGLEMKGASIEVDQLFMTSQKDIYAIGDCTDGVQLAHVASAGGIQVAETLFGQGGPTDFDTTAYCVYTKPELASVGLTEKDALDQGYELKVGNFPLYGNGKSVILGDVSGLVKIISDANSGEILGLHMAGNSATELISTGALALRLEATIDEILTTIYAHPTVSESIQEAAEDVLDKAIHISM